MKKKERGNMPNIRPISDLRNSANDISDFCRQTGEPVYITRNGTGDMVVLNMQEFERREALIDLYAKLAVAEEEIANGAEGEDFLTVAKQLREHVHGAV
jgi:prevent-host-death family protein